MTEVVGQREGSRRIASARQNTPGQVSNLPEDKARTQARINELDETKLAMCIYYLSQSHRRCYIIVCWLEIENNRKSMLGILNAK